jgi:hypothetical protein
MLRRTCSRCTVTDTDQDTGAIHTLADKEHLNEEAESESPLVQRTSSPADPACPIAFSRQTQLLTHLPSPFSQVSAEGATSIYPNS